MSRIGKSIYKNLITKSNYLGLGICRKNEVGLLMGTRFLRGSDKNVLKLFLIMFAQLCKYTKSHCRAHFDLIMCHMNYILINDFY